MGRDDADLTWTGRFRGSDAVSRSRQIDAMRIGGQQQTLTWADFSYLVTIKSFKAGYERAGLEAPYTIVLEVVQDNSTPATADDGDDADDAIDADVTDASDLGDDIGDDTLTSQLSTIQTGISALVGSVVQAAPSQLLGIVTSVQAAQGRVTILAAGLTSQIDDTADFGGINAGDDPDDIISAFTSTAAAVGAMPDVYAAGSLLGRVATNLGAVGRVRTAGHPGGRLDVRSSCQGLRRPVRMDHDRRSEPTD